MSIRRKAGVPAVTVESATSVMNAITLMKERSVDTVFVLQNGSLLGAFTQRDLAFRVALRRRDPDTTTVGEVMTSPPRTIFAGATIADAIEVMADHCVPQLPIIDEHGTITGMVRLQDTLREQKLDLTSELDSLIAYHSADGIGG